MSQCGANVVVFFAAAQYDHVCESLPARVVPDHLCLAVSSEQQLLVCSYGFLRTIPAVNCLAPRFWQQVSEWAKPCLDVDRLSSLSHSAELQ